MEKPKESREVAVFWDYENVTVNAEGLKVPVAEKLVDYTKSLGHVRLKRVYANWANCNLAINRALYSLGFDPIHVSMGKANSVDVKIAVDCLDTAILYPTISDFIIVTGDKDFISVVNWLKDNRKKVTIIGKSDIISEHLLLSADHFVSLEEFSKMDLQESTEENHSHSKKHRTIKFNDAIKCLIEVITNARDQTKSTRFNTIDNLMRSHPEFNYFGVKSIKPLEDGEVFSSFKKFIQKVESMGLIKSETVGGFKEIFLMEENPSEESEFGKKLPEIKDKDHWRIIMTLIDEIYQQIHEKFGSQYSTLIYLGNGLRKARQNFNLPYSNRVFRNSVNILIEKGYLIINDQGHIERISNYTQKRENYINMLSE